MRVFLSQDGGTGTGLLLTTLDACVTFKRYEYVYINGIE